MPTFERDIDSGSVSLYYEQRGDGFPILLIAPGGMRSTLTAWDMAPWNPIEELANNFTVIAMDQRNAGRSTGPITPTDGWDTYTSDQLALMDHLGFERFGVVGMCIGGSYIANLFDKAPSRATVAVAMQPIGLDNNREAFYAMYDAWAVELAETRPEVTHDAWASLKLNMYGSENQFFSASADDLKSHGSPTMVLMGDDMYHPRSASVTWANNAPNAEIIESWKQDPDLTTAKDLVTQFLLSNTVG